MSNPMVRAIETVDDIDGLAVKVGVDFDAVTISLGSQTAALTRGLCEEFAQAFVAACWEAADNARLMAEEAST